MWHKFLRVRCPSCHPTNSVKALKETQSSDPNQRLGVILSSTSTGLLRERVLAPLWQPSRDAKYFARFEKPTASFMYCTEPQNRTIMKKRLKASLLICKCDTNCVAMVCFTFHLMFILTILTTVICIMQFLHDYLFFYYGRPM